jgi:nucleoid-associated protein YgaU
MGLFDMFGKSFDEKVTDAITTMKTLNLGVSDLGAEVRGKVVTLTGQAPSREIATAAMEKLDELVAPDNIVNAIKVVQPEKAPQPPAEPAPDEEDTARIHEVVAGDTLSKLAQKYYGKSSEYMKIFEANRDILDNPDLIKVGQKLRIPE